MDNFNNHASKTRYVYSKTLLCLLLVICMVSIPLAMQANNVSVNNINNRSLLHSSNYSDYLWETIGIPSSVKIERVAFVAGDFSLDFVASAPLTYDHTTGGGFYNLRTIGRDKDVVESLEGGDFDCGDRVTFLTAVTVKSTAQGTQTIELDYSYLAASTGQPGVALGQILLVEVNKNDPGMIDNGESATATLNGGYPGTINGTKFEKPATLTGTVTVTGLDAGDKIIVRMDVLIECQIPSRPTGNLQGAITAGRVTVPADLSSKDTNLSVGRQTIPFKNVNLIGQGDCTLNSFDDACEGEIKLYTASSEALSPTFAWALDGDAEFVDGDGNTIASPGNSATARVRAKAPATGITGCYKVTVTITAAQTTTVTCCDLVTVYALPPAPTVSITEPSICGTTPYGSVTVTCPLNPENGSPIYEYQNGATGAWQTSPIFGNIAAGAQFSIRVRRIGTTGTTCASAATDCSNYATRTCTTPTPTTSCELACPTNGATSLKTESSSSLLGDTNNNDLTAYPVPFSDKAKVEYRAERSGNYVINLYDVKGTLIKQLKAGTTKAGEMQQIEVDGKGMPEGMYLIRVESDKGAKTLKLLKKE